MGRIVNIIYEIIVPWKEACPHDVSMSDLDQTTKINMTKAEGKTMVQPHTVSVSKTRPNKYFVYSDICW